MVISLEHWHVALNIEHFRGIRTELQNSTIFVALCVHGAVCTGGLALLFLTIVDGFVHPQHHLTLYYLYFILFYIIIRRRRRRRRSLLTSKNIIISCNTEKVSRNASRFSCTPILGVRCVCVLWMRWFYHHIAQNLLSYRISRWPHLPCGAHSKKGTHTHKMRQNAIQPVQTVSIHTTVHFQPPPKPKTF